MNDQSKELTKERSYFVAKDNRVITQSRYSLSLQQQKILLYFISRIKPLDEDTTMYIFDIKEFVEICGYTDSGYYYKNLKSDIRKIADTSCWVETVDGNHEILFRWIQGVDINKKSGKIAITFDKTVSRYLFDLKEQYTQYSLYNVLCLNHKYSIRLYEYLMAYRYRETITVNIDILRKHIDAESKTYDTLSHFKERVLVPAIEDINHYTDIHVEHELLKTVGSREYSQIRFTIRYKTINESVHSDLASKNRLDADTRKQSREREKRLQDVRKARKDLEEIDDEDLPD